MPRVTHNSRTMMMDEGASCQGGDDQNATAPAADAPAEAPAAAPEAAPEAAPATEEAAPEAAPAEGGEAAA